ncbi:hypothetical protein HWV62_7324 [Athelia sp. TMB]|nr:hypothetical protein HWV62_7324 [Athelia sp. TMB]
METRRRWLRHYLLAVSLFDGLSAELIAKAWIDSDTLYERANSSTAALDPFSKAQLFGKGEISPEDIVRRLFQECTPGQDNKVLLCQALEHTTSEELEKEITRIFHAQCRMAQMVIAAQMAWASVIAGLSSTGFTDPSFAPISDPAAALEMYKVLESPLPKGARDSVQQHEVFSLPTPLVVEVPRPATPPPSYIYPQTPGTESRTSFCFSDDSQYTDTPRYIRPLPVLPPANIEPVFPRPATPSHTAARPTSLHTHTEHTEQSRPPLPRGPRVAPAKPPGSNDARQSYPPFVQSALPADSSFLRTSYRTFSASSPSLRRRTSRITSRIAENVRAACVGHESFSASLPSLAICPESFDCGRVPDLVVKGSLPKPSSLPDVPILAPSGLYAPAPLRVIPHLPDLTGKLTKEGDYPAGRGGYADVWKCVMHQPMDECKVAVKVLQSHIYDAELESKIEKRIRREISIWQRLQHENVLPLLGTVQHFGRYISLVSPWMENGSLVQYLKECGDDMGILRRLQLAGEVASGLLYLHSSGVIHGDLSGMNVLITNEGKACLCDFGLSSLMLEFHDPTFCTSTIGANARWAAPEIYRISGEEAVPTATMASDVYSFGCILLEILSGLIPYHYLARDGQVLLELQNGTKPRRPQEGYVTDVLWAQINACWAEPATQRPTSQQLVVFLRDQFELAKRSRQ